MTYARNNIWNKRLPRGLGALVLIFSLGTIFWLSRNAVLLGTKAAVGNIPKGVQVSNLASSSATISYVTDQAVTGSISYGQDSKLGNVSFDIRDTSSPKPYAVHYVNLKNLTPSTKYLFSVVSGDSTFLNNSAPYELTTPANNATASAQQELVGKVTLDGNKIPSEAIGYVSTDTSQLLSVLLLPDGSYKIPLNTLLKKDLTGALLLSPETILRIQIVTPSTESRASVLASQTNPVPPIILSRNYDFSISTEPLASSTATGSAQISGFPAPDKSTAVLAPQILTPKTKQEFKDQQPVFEGKALPGNDVEITIQSEQEIVTTVQADASGNWQYRPTTKLAPGQHTLTVKTLDASGLIRTLTQSFTVFAEGSQFTEPSITPASPSPTIPQPTPTTTLLLTLTPTPTATPTTTPTATPTVPATLTPIITTPESSPIPQITTPPIPNSGSSTVVFGIIGTVLSIGIGGIIFLLL